MFGAGVFRCDGGSDRLDLTYGTGQERGREEGPGAEETIPGEASPFRLGVVGNSFEKRSLMSQALMHGQ